MESEKHIRQMTLLIESLETAWNAREDFFIGGNMFVYYSLLQTRQNDFRGPDVFVVLDTVRKERLSWVVWEEGGRTPNVIIELLSSSTESVDRGEKMEIYARILQVGEYYLFDPFTGQLEGYQLDWKDRKYRSIEPDKDGTLPCSQLGLRLGVIAEGKIGNCAAPWLRWLDDGGEILPIPREIAERETQRAERETQRAEREAQRAEELAAKLAAYEAKFGVLED